MNELLSIASNNQCFKMVLFASPTMWAFTKPWAIGLTAIA